MYQTVSLPGTIAQSIKHQHLLRAMDALVEHHDAVEAVLSVHIHGVARGRCWRGMACVCRHEARVAFWPRIKLQTVL